MLAVKFNVTFAPGCSVAAEDANFADHCTGRGADSCARTQKAQPTIALITIRAIATRQRKNSRMGFVPRITSNTFWMRAAAPALPHAGELHRAARYGVADFGR